MEEIVDFLRHLGGDAVDCLQILDARPRYRLGRAEMLEQRALARLADAGDLVERVGAEGLARLARCVPMAKRCASSRSRCTK